MYVCIYMYVYIYIHIYIHIYIYIFIMANRGLSSCYTPMVLEHARSFTKKVWF